MTVSPRLFLRLRPLGVDGAYTWMSLSGPLPTVIRHQELRRVLKTMAVWHGGPVHAVLPVDKWAGWTEVWVDNLSQVPAPHLVLRLCGQIRGVSPDRPGASRQLPLFPRLP